MRFARLRAKNDDDRILPLINVVFLLLIFFMLAGRIAAVDPFNIAPPNSASEGKVESHDLVVLLGADGRLALNGEEMDEATLVRRIEAVLRDGNAGPLRLKADGTVEATTVVAVMELLRDAGASSLHLLTVPGGGG